MATKSKGPDSIPTFFTAASVRGWLHQRIFRLCEDWHLAEDAVSCAMERLFKMWTEGKFHAGPGKFRLAILIAQRFISTYRKTRERHRLHDGMATRAESESDRETALKRYKSARRMLKKACTPKQLNRIVPYLQGTPVGILAEAENVDRASIQNSIDTGLLKFKRMNPKLSGPLWVKPCR